MAARQKQLRYGRHFHPSALQRAANMAVKMAANTEVVSALRPDSETKMMGNTGLLGQGIPLVTNKWAIWCYIIPNIINYWSHGAIRTHQIMPIDIKLKQHEANQAFSWRGFRRHMTRSQASGDTVSFAPFNSFNPSNTILDFGQCRLLNLMTYFGTNLNKHCSAW
jgi:hypothetical protein